MPNSTEAKADAETIRVALRGLRRSKRKPRSALQSGASSVGPSDQWGGKPPPYSSLPEPDPRLFGRRRTSAFVNVAFQAKVPVVCCRWCRKPIHVSRALRRLGSWKVHWNPSHRTSGMVEARRRTGRLNAIQPEVQTVSGQNIRALAPSGKGSVTRLQHKSAIGLHGVRGG